MKVRDGRDMEVGERGGMQSWNVVKDRQIDSERHIFFYSSREKKRDGCINI